MPVARVPRRTAAGATTACTCRRAQSSYGGPEGFARFVDAAHAAGLAVILDVVYNHVGASGAQALEAFGPYFTERYETSWGKAINYDDGARDGVREWVAAERGEAGSRDFHVDGLRLDAIHAIYDDGARHVLARARRARARRATGARSSSPRAA